MSADCLPLALARERRRRAGGRRPARGLARPARRRRRSAACARSAAARSRPPSGLRSGRAATRCATTSPIRSARASAATIVRDGKLDLWRAAELALARRGRRAASSASTSARPAIPSSSSPTAATASRGACRECSRVSPDRVRENYERIKSEVGPAVTVVAATKYVSVDEHAGARRRRRRRRRARTARRSSRRSTRATATAFRWHFIGHLQSRKAKIVNDLCELCHSLASESAAKRLTIPGARRGEPLGRADEVRDRARRAPGAFLELYPRRARADDDAARERRPRGVAAVLPAAARARRGARPGRAVDGHVSQDYRVAAEEGATYVRVGSVLFGQ